jgi:hypothetical protein
MQGYESFAVVIVKVHKCKKNIPIYKVHLFYEPGYMIPYVGNFMKEKSHVGVYSFTLAYGHAIAYWLRHCYKPEGRGFDTRLGEFLNLHNPSSHTKPLTEMSTRNIKIIMFVGSKVCPVHRADSLTAICEPIV